MKIVPKSSLIANRIITDTLCKTYQIARLEQIVRENLGCFSSRGVIGIINELGDQLFTHPTQAQELLNENEAIAIAFDNMMTSNLPQAEYQASIAQNTTKRKLSKTQSRVSIDNQAKSPSNSSSMIPKGFLDRKKTKNKPVTSNRSHSSQQPIINAGVTCVQIDQADTIEVLRQKILENQLKNEQQKKMKTVKQNIKQQTDICYDYDGNLLKIDSRNQKPKPNLVKSILSGKVTGQIEKLIQNNLRNSNTSKETTKVEVNSATKQKLRKKNKETPLTEPISFSKVTNLFEKANLEDGVKISQNKRSIQKNQKTLNVDEIKKLMSTRKVSKIEYSKIREYERERGFTKMERRFTEMESRVSPQQNLVKKFNDIQSNKTMVQHRKRFKTEYSRQTNNRDRVEVNNANLQLNLLLKYTEQVVTTPEDDKDMSKLDQINLKDKQRLEPVDQYNLLYIKHGENMVLPKSQTSKNIILPIIKKVRTIFPSGRQRNKQSGTLFRQLRRNFEQKLRK